MADTPLGLTADPEAINKWIAEAVLESALGKNIRAHAQSVLGNYDFKRAVEAQIRDIVLAEARSLVEKDEAMLKAIKDKVTEVLTPELITEIAQRATSKLARDY